MDDIVILSTSYKENLRHVAAVLDPLRQNCLALKPSKCRFNQPQVRFLGFVITTTGLSTDPAYSRAVTNFPSPSDQPTPSKKVDAVERFCGMAGFYRPSPNDQPTLSKKVDAVERLCGMAGFYRRFARNLAVHKRALRELTMANTLWIWGEAQQAAFLRRCQTHPKHCSCPGLSRLHADDQFHHHYRCNPSRYWRGSQSSWRRRLRASYLHCSPRHHLRQIAQCPRCLESATCCSLRRILQAVCVRIILHGRD
jgi:hypothetical protein